MDNLIAEKKTKPFIIVMTYGMTNEIQFGGLQELRHRSLPDGARRRVDPLHRQPTSARSADQPNRAMAGLSMGGMETKTDHAREPRHVLAHRPVQRWQHRRRTTSRTWRSSRRRTGWSSSATAAVKSAGTTPPRRRPQGGGQRHLRAAGINSHYYVSPETGHEWQSWRRSLQRVRTTVVPRGHRRFLARFNSIR